MKKLKSKLVETPQGAQVAVAQKRSDTTSLLQLWRSSVLFGCALVPRLRACDGYLLIEQV